MSTHRHLCCSSYVLQPHGIPVGQARAEGPPLPEAAFPQKFPKETRACSHPGETEVAPTILTLVNTLSPSTLSSNLSLWITLTVNPPHRAMNASAQVVSGFPTRIPLCSLAATPGLSVLLCLLGKENKYSKSSVWAEFSRTPHHLLKQLYIFVGSHFMSLHPPEYFDSKLKNNDINSASYCIEYKNMKANHNY